jgi:hypothetical protein
VCRIIYEVGNLMFVAEEVDQATSAGFAGREFGQLLRRGRHRKVSMIGITRRPAEIPRELTANAGRIISFRATEPTDVQYFRKCMGATAAAVVPRLPRLTGLAWRDDGEMQLVDVDPAASTYAFRPIPPGVTPTQDLDGQGVTLDPPKALPAPGKTRRKAVRKG